MSGKIDTYIAAASSLSLVFHHCFEQAHLDSRRLAFWLIFSCIEPYHSCLLSNVVAFESRASVRRLPPPKYNLISIITIQISIFKVNRCESCCRSFFVAVQCSSCCSKWKCQKKYYFSISHPLTPFTVLMRSIRYSTHQTRTHFLVVCCQSGDRKLTIF